MPEGGERAGGRIPGITVEHVGRRQEPSLESVASRTDKERAQALGPVVSPSTVAEPAQAAKPVVSLHTVAEPAQAGTAGPTDDRGIGTGDRAIFEDVSSSRRSEPGEGADPISAIEASLARERERDREHLLMAEVQTGRKEYEDYLRSSLRFADETLEATHKALTQETRRSRQVLDPVQVRETIRALGTEESWNQLLESNSIEITEATRNAIKDLVACIKNMDASDVSAESAEALLEDIEFLRAEISRALRTSKGMLPHDYTRELIATSRQVATEVMVGLTAASTTSALTGTLLVPEVAFTALGLAVAYSLKQLCRKAATSLLRIHSAQARLREYHHRLIRALGDLGRIVPWLATSDPLPDALETGHTVRLATVFLVACADQAAVAVVWPGRDRYRRDLRSVRKFLDEVGDLIAQQVTREIDEIEQDLNHYKDMLESYSDSVPTR